MKISNRPSLKHPSRLLDHLEMCESNNYLKMRVTQEGWKQFATTNKPFRVEGPSPPLPHPLPKGRLRLFENNILLYNRKSTCCSNPEQSSEVVASDGALQLLSGMSRNQSCSVQSNLWQETTSLWDTPAAHLYASQHHKQLDRGGGRGGAGEVRSTAAVRGEICFHFSTFSGWDDQTIAALFPSLLLTRLNPSAPVSFPPAHTLKRLPREGVPLLPRDCCTTGLHGCRAQRPHRVPTSLSRAEDQLRNSWSEFKCFQTGDLNLNPIIKYFT